MKAIKKTRSRNSTPTAAPALEILKIDGRAVELRLTDADNSTSRRKVRGAAGATIFSFAGEHPPTDASQWKFECNTTTTRAEIYLRGDVATGATIWLTAWWFDKHKAKGPACEAVSTNPLAGGVLPVTKFKSVRLAA